MAKRKAPKSIERSDEEKRLREFVSEFLADWRADEDFRKNSREDNDFYDGNQLTQEEIEVLEERGQPPVVINRIKPKMDAIFGMQEAMRVDTKAYPAGQREQEAEAVSEFFRTVEDDNDFDDHESLAFEDISICGRGWYEIGKKWDGLQSRHFVRRAYCEDIVPDRRAREMDLSDAKRVHKTVWMDLADAQAMFPKQAAKLAMAANDKALDLASDPENNRKKPDQYAADGPLITRKDLNEFVNQKAQRVRVVTTYYRELVPKRFFFHAKLPGGSLDVTKASDLEIKTLRAAHPDGQLISQMDKSLHSLTFTWNAELEHLRDLRSYDPEAKFPFIMMEGYRERNSTVPYGLVRQMKDPQREVNKRRSKHLHLITMRQTVFERGAFQNPDTAREEVQRPDGWIELQPGSFGKFQVQSNLELSQAHFLLLQTATQEIDSAGVTRELEGRSGASSGRDFQLRQQQAVQGIRKLISNLRSGRRRVGFYLFDEFRRENPELELTKLDIIVEEAPDTLNLQQETFDKLANLAEKGVVPPDFLDLLIEVSSLEPAMKKRFLERLEQRAQAQAQLMAAQAAAAGGGAPPGAGGVQ